MKAFGLLERSINTIRNITEYNANVSAVLIAGCQGMEYWVLFAKQEC